MARILYGLAGQGLGHASRSQTVAEALLESGHDVRFVTSMQAYSFLHALFPDRVHEGFGLRLVYENNRVNPWKTLHQNLREGFLSGGLKRNASVFKHLFHSFRPHLLISDYDPFSIYWANRFACPAISLDHQHLITHTRFQRPPNTLRSFLLTYLITRLYYTRTRLFIITNFFNGPVHTHPAVVVPPIVRNIVRNTTPTIQNHILAYQTRGADADALLRTMRAVNDAPIRAYGFEQTGTHDHIHFQPRSVEGFLQDLASAKAVIASAGYNLIGECIHLRKPMLLSPIADQFEQEINAHYVQKLGIGHACNHPTPDILRDFLRNLPHYQAQLNQTPVPSLQPTLHHIERILQKTNNAPAAPHPPITPAQAV